MVVVQADDDFMLPLLLSGLRAQRSAAVSWHCGGESNMGDARTVDGSHFSESAERENLSGKLKKSVVTTFDGRPRGKINFQKAPAMKGGSGEGGNGC